MSTYDPRPLLIPQSELTRELRVLIDARFDLNRAIQEFEDYQRLTSQGKLGEAGQKLEQHKRTLEEIRQKAKP